MKGQMKHIKNSLIDYILSQTTKYNKNHLYNKPVKKIIKIVSHYQNIKLNSIIYEISETKIFSRYDKILFEVNNDGKRF